MKAQWRAALAALAVVSAAACGGDSGTDPQTPAVSSLAVSGVRVDAATFQNERKFELGLLAADASGQAILSEDVEITAAVTAVEGANVTARASLASFATGSAMPTVDVVQTVAQGPGSKPISSAIDIDDSGSMSWSDPNDLRADAAKAFWEAVLGERPENRVALFDFGAGSTTGFSESRLLQEWTDDETALEAQLSNIYASGGTPLYESAYEVLGYIDTTRAASQYSRVMLLLTDGEPNGYGLKDQTIARAKNAGITIHTVGLGPASDVADEYTRSDVAVATVRELAEQTGGVYASATDAAALSQIFSTLAKVTSQGQLITALQLSQVYPSGTRISGTVTVNSGGRSATASWSFVVP
jgi:Mg-chelatase subunit ChlD